jgi:hypothetical protein
MRRGCVARVSCRRAPGVSVVASDDGGADANLAASAAERAIRWLFGRCSLFTGADAARVPRESGLPRLPGLTLATRRSTSEGAVETRPGRGWAGDYRRRRAVAGKCAFHRAERALLTHTLGGSCAAILACPSPLSRRGTLASETDSPHRPAVLPGFSAGGDRPGPNSSPKSRMRAARASPAGSSRGDVQLRPRSREMWANHS